MANKKTEVEANVKLEEVKKAEEKVEQIKAEKAAKCAARCAKRLEWKGPFKLVGKIVNAYDEKPLEMWTATIAGGGLGGLIFFGVEKAIDKYGNKTEEVTEVDEISDEAEEAPFEEA